MMDENTPRPQERRSVFQKRYKLYDKIRIPLKTMDLIITLICVLLVVAVVAGIIIGNG